MLVYKTLPIATDINVDLKKGLFKGEELSITYFQ